MRWTRKATDPAGLTAHHKKVCADIRSRRTWEIWTRQGYYAIRECEFSFRLLIFLAGFRREMETGASKSIASTRWIAAGLSAFQRTCYRLYSSSKYFCRKFRSQKGLVAFWSRKCLSALNFIFWVVVRWAVSPHQIFLAHDAIILIYLIFIIPILAAGYKNS